MVKTIKNLDVQDILQQIESTKKFIKQTQESSEQVKKALNGVTTLHDGFEGNTADSIRSFFVETHKPFLEFMNSFLIQYEETLSSVNEEVLSFESDEHGFIREEYLEDKLKSRLVKASTSLTSTSIDINQQLLYVKDIVNVPSVDSEPFINSINKGKEKLSETLSNMYDMDAKAANKLDKPEQDIERMKTYLSKLKDAIDKNNITVDSYSSEQLTKQNFYKDFKLQAGGRQALTSDKPIPLTEQEYKALQDQIKDSKTVQDDRFEWDGEYFTLEDGRIIRAYTDPNSDSAVSKMAFEFVSSIPENREDLKEYKQEEGKSMFTGAVKDTVDFFFGDAITLFGPDATLEERAWAGVFLFVKPAKVLDKVGSPFLSSTKKYIDDLAESKGIPNTNQTKADKLNNRNGSVESDINTPTAFKQKEFASTYDSRIQQTPAPLNPKVQFDGIRGESLSTLKPPPDPQLKKILDEAGVYGIPYKNGVPDFSSVAKAQVEIKYMLGGKGTYGGKARRANFNQSDQKLAAQINKSPKLAKDFGFEQDKVTARDIKKYRETNQLTWHELNDVKTMQLVPTKINSEFGHLGGVGEINAGAFEPKGFAKKQERGLFDE